MARRTVVLLALSALLAGVLAGSVLSSRPVYQIQSGNVNCIGFKTMEFYPETATLRLEIANIYGQRPCGPEDIYTDVYTGK